jgi:opacity protein-like surface antigen
MPARFQGAGTMKNKLKTVVFSSFFLAALAAASAAQAQFYWRFETGSSKATEANAHDKNFDGISVASICGDATCSKAGELDDLGTSAILGLGLGFRLGQYFRTDLVFAARDGYRIEGQDKRAVPTHFHINVKSKSVMLNSYIDFPAPQGAWRPFLGIGVGVSRNTVSEISGELFDLNETFSAPGGTKTSTAGAIMLGVSYPLTTTTTLELGYRFVNLGKFETSAGDTVDRQGNTVTTGTYGGLTGTLRAHEWTIGLRF